MFLTQEDRVKEILFVASKVWQYRLWIFQTGGKKLEIVLLKIQHTHRKFLNFENWTNVEPQ